MKEFEITNFNLVYDGMYLIRWDNEEIRVFLELNTILKMLEIEGLSYQDVNRIISEGKRLHFTKITIVLFREEEDGKIFYRTSDMDDMLKDKNITMFDIELKENNQLFNR
ncbi:hypothetical protein [Flavobacterium gilvum]|uniref:Uncharacterized protein n=1 Tax=Flavobacterium gilvum TaxID=1492737 RepID=A0AAC9I5H4_9FLAO|nr:hypothetical protein [Flavobacterium gilvum]AOW10475.1 hypothetical protein EM308_13730 [Flavobacterium gilvum]KFC61146.1 hypothetical protein FEM08_00820 [Flavobacterium gilvum]